MASPQTALKPAFINLPPKLLLISLKMYFTPEQTLTYLDSLLNSIVPLVPSSKLLLGLIPDFLTISSCSDKIREAAYRQKQTLLLLLGAQDCFWTASGSFTGEVSPKSLAYYGVSIVELGHAERRRLFHETNEHVARKAVAAADEGLVPLVCIGEVSAPGGSGGGDGDEQDPAWNSAAIGAAVRECEGQILPVLDMLHPLVPVVFAYEPVWAIGAAKPAAVEYVGYVVQGIRAVVARRRKGAEAEGQVRVLYGGSAGPGLWSDGGLGKHVDGMFLGRFAHHVDGVKRVVEEVVADLE